MTIRVKLLSDHGVVVSILSGIVTPRDVIETIDRLPSADKHRIVLYVEPTADLSQLSVAFIPEIRRAIADKLRALYGSETSFTAWVCEPGSNARFFDFWRRYLEVGGEHPASELLFPALEAACDWLDLPEPTRQAVSEEIETHRDEWNSGTGYRSPRIRNGKPRSAGEGARRRDTRSPNGQATTSPPK